MKIYLGNNNIGSKLGSGTILFGKNINISSPDTTAPSIIGSPTIDEITETSFRVTWSLDEGSTGQIEYGTTDSYGNTSTLETNYLTTHIQTISGLTAGTEYHFRIIGEDEAGNSFQDIDRTVTTGAADVTSPTITSGPTESGITASSVNISWTLDEAATGQVEYGTTNSYGSTSPLESNYLTSHSINLTGLSENTLYYYRVIGEDASGNQYIGTDQTFTSAESGDQFVPCTPGGGTTYNPTSAADISNAANAGKTAIITNSFNATGITFAAGQDIQAGGGVISGSNINLNGACIQDSYEQIFANNVTFSSIYENSRLSPEAFGAVGNGVTNDNTALNTLINNCSYAIGNPTSTYIKNNPTNYTRSGLFNWNMNGCILEVTSSSNFNLSQVSTSHVFDFTNTSVKFFDGTFDLNNVYGRLFYFHGQPTIEFDNCTVRNLYSPNANNIRALAFRHTINAATSGLQSIKYTNNTIHNVVCQGDGNFNDGGGISKAWWYTMSGVTNSTNFNVLHQNNTVYDIIGDDAEAFYAIGGDATNAATWLLDNEYYYNCTRRCIKVNVSNVTLQNSTMEEMDNSLFQSAQQVGSMVDFFRAGSYVENIVVNNNIIRNRPGQDIHYWLLSFTEARNITVTNNTISALSPGNFNGLRLGSNTGSYAGYLENFNVSGNTFENLGVQMMSQYSPTGQLDINNNNFNYTNTSSFNSNTAILRTVNTSGTKGNINFGNNTININFSSSTSLFNGILYSAGAAITNVDITDTTITYVNATVARPIGYLVGNFGNTNSVVNSTLIGDSGTNAIVVNGGDQSVVITNSFGDGSTPITVQ